ncbi:MAG: hypothetical protein U0939_18865 [Pirellulales bacterium]
MTQKLDLEADYFAPRTSWLWKWSDDGQVVVWHDGTTIAFREELFAALQRLAPDGLPRFGTLILILGACRESFDSAAVVELVHRQYLLQSTTPLIAGLTCDMLKQGLNRLHAARDSCRTPAERAELAAFLLEGQPRLIPPSTARELVQSLAAGLPPMALHDGETSSKDLELYAADLYKAFERFDLEAFQRWRQTGVEETVAPAATEPPPGEGVRELLRRLLDDDELAGLARLATALTAAIRLPRPADDWERLPNGGVADIANRGELDRLLLSELAHDDLTLAVRVAMREALYVRREPLPRSLPHVRLLLLDVGLRMWGVPRMFATAVALAVASQADARTTVAAFRAEGTSLTPIQLDSLSGVQAHLAALDAGLHLGRALPTLAERARSESQTADAIVVTHMDAWEDDEFRRSLAELDVDSLHLALVDRDGRLQWRQQTRRGSRLLSEAQLDLDQTLYAARQNRPRAARGERRTRLPAIWHCQPFPFRFSTSTDAANTVIGPHGLAYTFTGNGRLLFWDGPTAVELARGLPHGRLLWGACEPHHDQYTAIVGHLGRNAMHLVRFSRSAGLELDRVESLPLRAHGGTPRSVAVHDGAVLIFYDDAVEACCLTSGESLGITASSAARIFSSPRQIVTHGLVVPVGKHELLRISVTDRSLRCQQFDPFADLEEPLPPNAQLTAAIEATWPRNSLALVLSTGHVRPHGACELKYSDGASALGRGDLRIARVSRDGLRLFLNRVRRLDPGVPTSYELDLTDGAVTAYYRGQDREQVWFDSRLRSNIRTHFRAIGVQRNRQLVLASPRGHVWTLQWNPSDDCLSFPRTPERKPEDLQLHPFEPWPDSTNADAARYLRVATWPDGSRAILDARGMLHLQSSDESLPECSLLLNERRLAGWDVDCGCGGPAEFLAPAERRGAMASLQERCLGPFLERLPCE